MTVELFLSRDFTPNLLLFLYLFTYYLFYRSPQQPAEEEEEGKEDEESSEDSDGDGGSDGEEGERGRFGERTVSSLPAPGEEVEEGGAVMPGSFRGFGFKKRAAGAAGGGRPQIRQRTSDLS